MLIIDFWELMTIRHAEKGTCCTFVKTEIEWRIFFMFVHGVSDINYD